MARRAARTTGAGTRTGIARRVAVAIASLAMLTGILTPTAATAAPGDLLINLEIADGITGESIDFLQAETSDAGNAPNYFMRYNIEYTCGPVLCQNASVYVSPQALDPNYNTYRFATYSLVSLPGTTVTGNANLGWTVPLGTLQPGTSGSFFVEFRYQQRGTGLEPASFFPNGFDVPASVEMRATGLDPVAATDSVEWRILTPETPSTSITGPALARADTQHTYTLRMSAACQWERSSAAHGEPAYECARSTRVVQTLPAGAVFVSASNDGVYDAATNTVTWNDSGVAASRGWKTSQQQPRTVIVTFPESLFESGPCYADFSTSVAAEVTYLSGAVKTVNASTPTRVNACEPFASATLIGKATTRDAGTAVDPLVWERSTGNYWYVRTDNRANVPGVATVVDNNLDQAGLSVTQVRLIGATGVISYTLDNGVTGTTGTVESYAAPSGRRIVAATVVSSLLNGPNLEQSSQPNRTEFQVRYHYTVADNVPDEGWERTNTANVTMSYPDTNLAPVDLGSASATVTAVPRPAYIRPSLGAVVQGGGQPAAGTPVTYTVASASTSDVEPGVPYEGQYVFVAPADWEIIPGSAAIATGTDFTFEYYTVTLGGVTRDAVRATRPPGTLWGANVTWPTFTVQATPTASAAGGSTGTAAFYMGDANHNFTRTTAIWGSAGNFRYEDAADLDQDGVTTESYAYTTVNTVVGSTNSVTVLKEICSPNPDAVDGCDWLSNPDVPVPVSPDTDDITYRVTITNAGSTIQSGVVAYDVLPHIGDTGLTAVTAGTPRGSTFVQSLTSATPGADVNLSFSASTNPCRAEVYPSAPGCVTDWGSTATGAQAIRAIIPGTLGAGASRTFTYTAAVVGDPVDGDIACNSVAIDSTSTAPTEPRAVCAQVQAADLAVSAPNRLPLQDGRPGVVPFSVVNYGGAATATGSVEIAVPAGLTVTSLEFDGWTCTTDDGSAPLAGPATLDCALATGGLVLDTPVALNLPVLPTAPATNACVSAEVSGPLYDGVPANNTAQACFTIIPGEPELTVAKTDGVTTATMGDLLTYTVTVSNALVGEALTDVSVVDSLPGTVEFVSATGGGVHTGADANGAGGIVTWSIPTLAATGTPTSGGTETTPVPGASAQFTVTVLVLQEAEASSTLVNTVEATADDPADPAAQLSDTATDTDSLVRTAGITLVKSSTTTSYDAVGDTISYDFLVTNTGTVTLTGVAITETEFTGAGTLAAVTCPVTTLAPDASTTCTVTYTVQQGDLDAGSVSNAATASGTAPSGVTAPVSEESTVEVDAVQSATLSLVKSATPTTATAHGDEIVYEFVVTNTGNVTLSGVEITEVAFDGEAENLSDIVCPTGDLAPTASVTCEATYELAQADVDRGSVSNTATATADAPGSLADPVSNESDALVTIDPEAALTLEKTISTPDVDSAGQTVTYLFDVTNIGNVTVTSIEIDELAFTGTGTPVSIDCPVTTLAPGADTTCVGTYVLTQADVDALRVDNTAVATGLDPNSEIVESEESSAELIIISDPGLSLVKSASPGTLVLDDVVTYSFVVTNIGNVTVTDIDIDETEFTGSGTLSAIECAATSLAPDTQTVCTATYTITQDDVDAGDLANTAIATGTTPDGPTSSDFSTVELPFTQAPDVALVKSTDVAGYAAVGDIVTYGFRVTNTGNVSLSALEIIEDDFSGSGELGDITCPALTLLPGQFTDCVAPYSVTQADLDAGELENTAYAEALAPGADDPIASDDSSVSIPFTGDSGLALEKVGTAIDTDSNGVVTAGDQILWTFTVTNTGATTLTDLAIDDPTAGDVVCDATILPPGASIDCVAVVHRITQAEATAGTVVNVATATAAGSGGVAVASAAATATVAVEAVPLAFTGSSPLLAGLVALLLLLLGAGVLVAVRMRRITRA